MSIQIHAFLCREDNIGALVHDPKTGACAAIDAPEEGPILKALEQTGWSLSDILVTHRHADHVAAIAPLKERFDCRVIAPLKAEDAVPDADMFVREGDFVQVGDLRADVWETPGHCDDHVSYWFAADRVIFAGDTIFTLGCGRLLEGTYPTFWASLQRIAALPEDARVYSGHDYTLSNGRFALAADPDNAALKERMKEAEAAKAEGRFLIPSMIGAEKATNPFLRADRPELARSVGKEGAPPVEVFQALREWKNRF
ncbi:hydroxyacylglutathione hydrolase [Microvirga puerhi]|uniref:Hydroxyacylglutathione hydrolase n=1 Tax=Microvirga puerhi TaxID=2876078 RepID=A0ABS7VQ46_9HYPH|nr:hydroxyacylglutathione hydrolase [Microvirga puerhi]MBZ6077645.1 hydroxyacylglutathione hydrolase [Microvirga puerhi]